MYVLDKRIEELEFKVAKLHDMRDDIVMQKQDAVDLTIDMIRQVISDNIDDLISNISMEVDLSEVDSMLEQDIEDELREDFIDEVRDNL